MAGLTIGRLVRETDVNKETIRYYQRIGLLKEPEKPNHGYRIYPDEYICRRCWMSWKPSEMKAVRR